MSVVSSFIVFEMVIHSERIVHHAETVAVVAYLRMTVVRFLMDNQKLILILINFYSFKKYKN
jgi:hypothetical protein